MRLAAVSGIFFLVMVGTAASQSPTPNAEAPKDSVKINVADSLAPTRSKSGIDSIVVITSDHGEEFFEHGQWQHDQLYEECLRVPLMVRLPGGLGGTYGGSPVGCAARTSMPRRSPNSSAGCSRR